MKGGGGELMMDSTRDTPTTDYRRHPSPPVGTLADWLPVVTGGNAKAAGLGDDITGSECLLRTGHRHRSWGERGSTQEVSVSLSHSISLSTSTSLSFYLSLPPSLPVRAPRSTSLSPTIRTPLSNGKGSLSQCLSTCLRSGLPWVRSS